jgi:hypothetical protein
MEFLRRYTTLSSALDVLAYKRVTLVSPSKWDDRNDAYFLELYRKHRKAEALFALCCSRAPETYHHWRIFTPASEGICLEIKKRQFAASLISKRAIRAKNVSYLLLKDVDELDANEFERLPFLKRWGFADEEEWRAIALSENPRDQSYSVPLRLDWINRVIVNPWMPLVLFEAVRKTVSELPDCSGVRVTRSSLIDNARWRAAGDDLKAMADKRARRCTLKVMRPAARR